VRQLTAASRAGFNLDLSMFERLATPCNGRRQRNGNVVQLQQQRRMRPDIADLIRLEVG
jgi:hypothetical protein